MNKLVKLFLLINYLVVFSIWGGMNKSVAQEDDETIPGMKPDKMFWFFINVQVKKNKQTETNEYLVKPSGSGVYLGNEEQFRKDLWGQRTELRLAVGPYWDRGQATLAQRIYSQLNRNTTALAGTIDPTMEVHWYYLKVKQKRVGYQLEPTAARVATGTLKEFYDSLREGLIQEMLAVGPFLDYGEAEDSKALYRSQETDGEQ